MGAEHEREDQLSLQVIARIHNDFTEKFGIPRQSGLVPQLRSRIVFKPEYRQEQALRGLEGYSHIWLIWGFSEVSREGWSPTVRPPRLGGNTRMGVFATRSPFRPNPIGLSCVQLEAIEKHPQYGMVLTVLGADMMDGTPIYDIKPYLPYTDSRPQAVGGFAEQYVDYALTVDFPDKLLQRIPPDKQESLKKVLSGDPRPTYQNDPERIYGMAFGENEIRFRVMNGVLTVVDVMPKTLEKAQNQQSI